MESNRELIEAVLKFTASFKQTEMPETNFNQNQGETRASKKQSYSTWIQLVETYCPQILIYYPKKKYEFFYSQKVCFIEIQLNFKGSNSSGFKYILIKSQKQVEHFKKQWKKNNPNNHERQLNIVDILAGLSLKNFKDKFYFEDFIEQITPHDKWNISVLGQYKVDRFDSGDFKSCIKETVCKPCQRFAIFYMTITTQCLILSEQYLAQGIVDEVIPYTAALRVEYLTDRLQTYGHRFAIRIISGKTQICFAFEDLYDLIKFAYTLNLVKKKAPYFNQNIRFNSFSPERKNNWTKFYHDGESYFSDLHDEIERAEKKICITGWCITPYFLLKRKDKHGNPQKIETGESRLDRTLGRAARRDVKIFILVFQEPSLFINNDSFNVWNIFENMSQNFKVLRHPSLIIPQLWSHHEKSVIIDEKVAFMGGLDICYGRWDNHQHSINGKGQFWDGADYCNERQRAITEPRKYQLSNLDRINQPRMPWHDIALQIKGPAIVDLQRHFCQYWYFAIRDLSDDPQDLVANFKNRYNQLHRQQRQANEKQQEKMRNSLNKINPSQQQMGQIELQYAYSKNKSIDDKDYRFRDRVRNATQAFKDLIQNRQNISSKEIIVEGFSAKEKPGRMNLQLCRSSCSWSTGIQTVEHSIYNAYLQLIKSAHYFIYIENQFFMSYQNQISEVLAQRIAKAYIRQQKLKVIVMMPLLPGFEGKVTDSNSGVLRVQMQLQYQAINRHQSSIFTYIYKFLPKGTQIDMKDFIYFFGLRDHALFGENHDIPKTEIIYVHSKLMIVDDRFMIIGSANINDRSLLGSRDSQLAMVIEDPNGFYGNGSIFDFRCQIFKEHFGMDEKDCSNIADYWEELIKISIKNTQIYRKVFGCYPDNTAVNFKDVVELEKNADLKLYPKKITRLYGHYVQWPIDFLKNENLNLKFGQLQFIAPISSFT